MENLPQDGSDLHKFVVGYRLTKIARSQPTCLASILWRIRRSNYQDRNMLTFVAGSNPLEHFDPIDFREVEVDQENMWKRCVRISLRSRNELDRPLAVGYNMDLQRQTLHSYRFTHQQRVWQVIFSQQKIQWSRNRLVGRIPGR